VSYAREIAKTEQAHALSQEELLDYLWRAPVVFDNGEGPTVSGCRPAQRSKIWPLDGMNCWEATAHFVGWAIAQQLEIEIHIFDSYLGKIRHVFPAWRRIGSTEQPAALLLQPPVGVSPGQQGIGNLTSLGMARTQDQGGRAQAWYNDVLGGIHIVGDKVLKVFGQGELADSLADFEGDDLPDWARTKRQLEAKQKAQADEAKKQADEAKRKAVNASSVSDKVIESLKEKDSKSATENPPPANALWWM
jgi:hypothetical protein